MNRPRATTATLALVWILQVTAPLAPAGPYSGPVGGTGGPDEPVAGFVDGAPNPAFVAWADTVVDYAPANPAELDIRWQDPSLALGPVTGDRLDVVSLGELSAADVAGGLAPGTITLSFPGRIFDGPGPDFGVFENAIPGAGNSVFAELAYVEVSTDGVHFARFEPVSLTDQPVWALGTIDATDVYNLAGKHAHGHNDNQQPTAAPSWATPLDLSELAGHPLVAAGLLSVDKIRYVRLVDIPGTGDFPDSRGEAIYDPHPTAGSGGFDLEAVGLLHLAAAGDLNLDGQVGPSDIDTMTAALQAGARDLLFDYNDDGLVGPDDLDAMLLSEFSSLVGDLDLDGAVTAGDLEALLAGFGQPGSYIQGDLSGNGMVGFEDFRLLATRYGQSVVRPAVAPEPTLLPLSVLLVGIVRTRPRRRKGNSHA